jgi:hypothetical protein
MRSRLRISMNAAPRGARIVLPHAGAEGSLELEVGFVLPIRELAGVMRAFDQALFRVIVDPVGGRQSVPLWLSRWGDHDSLAAATEARRRTRLGSVFG